MATCTWCGRSMEKPAYYWSNIFGTRKYFCSQKCAYEWADAEGIDHSNVSQVSDCFITTATCKSRNLPDDCHELTVLRMFRDTYMKTDEKMSKEVEEYYLKAPLICKKIDELENSSELYEEIYQKYIKPAVAAVEAGENDKAHDIYSTMFLKLNEEYNK
ncbi:MAG: hypothetical protein K5829_05825 [Treponema sp.]|nr:hypothetical protein [Treponema sp.]